MVHCSLQDLLGPNGSRTTLCIQCHTSPEEGCCRVLHETTYWRMERCLFFTVKQTTPEVHGHFRCTRNAFGNRTVYKLTNSLTVSNAPKKPAWKQFVSTWTGSMPWTREVTDSRFTCLKMLKCHSELSQILFCHLTTAYPFEHSSLILLNKQCRVDKYSSNFLRKPKFIFYFGTLFNW